MAPERLGILDWGIGGVGVWRALQRRAPGIPVLYFADSGYTPYGLVSRRELGARVQKLAQRLVALGATSIVVACNAASTVLDDFEIGRELGVPLTGMIRPFLERFPEHTSGTVGVLGGRRTIRSQMFRRGLEQGGRRVVQRIAQPLSAHVERGSTQSAKCAHDLDRILAPLRTARSVVLACTHYPAVADLIQARLPTVELIDPAERVSEYVLSAFPLPAGRAVDCVLTTGSASSTRSAALRAWGADIGPCIRQGI
jgi:glutamate racemase